MSKARWSLATQIVESFQLSGAAAAAVYVCAILLCMVIPYLLGSLNFGLIISRNKYHDDIRKHGSGNAGTTNMLRTYGKGAAVATLIGDMLKAAVAVGLGYLLINFQADVYTDAGKWAGAFGEKPGAAVAGLFVMLGHMFPCFYKFKGGKGVATMAMVILMLNPIAFLILLGIFIIIAACTRYVSLASIMGAILCPIILTAFEQAKGSFMTGITSVLMAVLVVFMHRENIKRLKDGKESKLSFRKKKDGQEAAAEAPLSRSQRKKQQQQQKKADEERREEYTYVHCPGCGSLIPQSRRVCAYCNTVNPQYVPDPAEEKDGGKKNSQRVRNKDRNSKSEKSGT